MAGDEYLLDTPLVREFVAAVRASIDSASSPQEACAAIRPLFAELLADQDWLPARYREGVPDSGMGGGIGQWLLFRAPDGSLSLFSLVVPPGSETPVHDHLAWGLVGLYAGTQDEDIYAEGGGGHPPRANDLRGDLGLDPSADERHRLHLAPHVRPAVGRARALPLGLGQR